MSTNWFKDMQEMHKKYGVDKWMNEEKKSDWSRLNKYMDFRIKMMQEELDETRAAFENENKEEVVDGIIDLCVFAIGTLEVFGVDANKAWDQVYKANMSKDLVKPEGWEGPTHKGNHGNITDSFQ